MLSCAQGDWGGMGIMSNLRARNWIVYPATIFFLVLLVSQTFGGPFDIGKAIKKVEDIKDNKRVKQLRALLPISLEEEIELGERVAAGIQSKYGVYRNEPIERYIALVGTAVAWQGSRPELAYSFTILDTDEVNAYAAMGGFIMISRGLLSAMHNEAELAAVLGHEIWHIEAKHEIKRVETAQRTGILTSEALSAMTDQELDGVADYCYSILEKGRSRDVELEADIEGAALAAKLGYDPRALEGLLKRFRDSTKQGPLAKLHSTHPDFSDRVNTLHKQRYETNNTITLESRYRSNVLNYIG